MRSAPAGPSAGSRLPSTRISPGPAPARLQTGHRFPSAPFPPRAPTPGRCSNAGLTERGGRTSARAEEDPGSCRLLPRGQSSRGPLPRAGVRTPGSVRPGGKAKLRRDRGSAQVRLTPRGLGREGPSTLRAPPPEPRGGAAARLWRGEAGRTGQAAAQRQCPSRPPPQQVGVPRAAAGGGARLGAEPRRRRRARGGAGAGGSRSRSRSGSGSRERGRPGARGSSPRAGAGTRRAERAGAATADKGAARARPPRARAPPRVSGSPCAGFLLPAACSPRSSAGSAGAREKGGKGTPHPLSEPPPQLKKKKKKKIPKQETKQIRK